MYVFMDSCQYKGQRLMTVIYLDYSPLFLRLALSLNLHVNNFATLIRPYAPRIFLSSPSSAGLTGMANTNAPSFSMGAGYLNSGTHVCETSILSYKTSLQPQYCHFFEIIFSGYDFCDLVIMDVL